MILNSATRNYYQGVHFGVIRRKRKEDLASAEAEKLALSIAEQAVALMPDGVNPSTIYIPYAPKTQQLEAFKAELAKHLKAEILNARKTKAPTELVWSNTVSLFDNKTSPAFTAAIKKARFIMIGGVCQEGLQGLEMKITIFPDDSFQIHYAKGGESRTVEMPTV